jgi:hypothetical protein
MHLFDEEENGIGTYKSSSQKNIFDQLGDSQSRLTPSKRISQDLIEGDFVNFGADQNFTFHHNSANNDHSSFLQNQHLKVIPEMEEQHFNCSSLTSENGFHRPSMNIENQQTISTAIKVNPPVSLTFKKQDNVTPIRTITFRAPTILPPTVNPHQLNVESSHATNGQAHHQPVNLAHPKSLLLPQKSNLNAMMIEKPHVMMIEKPPVIELNKPKITQNTHITAAIDFSSNKERKIVLEGVNSSTFKSLMPKINFNSMQNFTMKNDSSAKFPNLSVTHEPKTLQSRNEDILRSKIVLKPDINLVKNDPPISANEQNARQLPRINEIQNNQKNPAPSIVKINDPQKTVSYKAVACQPLTFATPNTSIELRTSASSTGNGQSTVRNFSENQARQHLNPPERSRQDFASLDPSNKAKLNDRQLISALGRHMSELKEREKALKLQIFFIGNKSSFLKERVDKLSSMATS